MLVLLIKNDGDDDDIKTNVNADNVALSKTIQLTIDQQFLLDSLYQLLIKVGI